MTEPTIARQTPFRRKSGVSYRSNHSSRATGYRGDFQANPATCGKALQVMDFAGGLVQLVAVRAYLDGALVGRELKDLRQDLPQVDTRVAAIFRKDRPIIPRGDTVIEADDEVFFLAAKEDIRRCLELQKLEKPYRRILIAGGGNIGARLAISLENQYRVKLIERGQTRCKELSEILNKTVVLQGDASDQDLLLEERIDDVDVFCAVTNSDEAPYYVIDAGQKTRRP